MPPDLHRAVCKESKLLSILRYGSTALFLVSFTVICIPRIEAFHKLRNLEPILSASSVLQSIWIMLLLRISGKCLWKRLLLKYYPTLRYNPVCPAPKLIQITFYLALKLPCLPTACPHAPADMGALLTLFDRFHTFLNIRSPNGAVYRI